MLLPQLAEEPLFLAELLSLVVLLLLAVAAILAVDWVRSTGSAMAVWDWVRRERELWPGLWLESMPVAELMVWLSVLLRPELVTVAVFLDLDHR